VIVKSKTTLTLKNVKRFFLKNYSLDFSIRISICWWTFVLTGTLMLGVALLTVSWQAVGAAMANPVDSLRY